MTISIKIHKINISSDSICIATIKDGENIVVDKANIGLELNPDGTANNIWIQEKAKRKVLEYRKLTTNTSIITIDTGE